MKYLITILVLLFGLTFTNNAYAWNSRVGYRPVITVLPHGLYTKTIVKIDKKRRYVTIGINFGTSTIGRVSTFSYYRRVRR